MISVAFIGIALVAAISAQGKGVVLADQARFTGQAVFLARYVLSQAQSDPDLDLSGDSQSFVEPLDHLVWDRETEAVAGLPGVYRVQIWVRGEDDPRKSGVTLQGFVYRETE
jgi:hypothetical protein